MIPIFDFDYCTKEELYHAVDEVRETLNVKFKNGHIDLKNLRKSIDYVKVGFIDLPSKRIRGAASPKEGLILLNSNREPLERNFDFIHELFHLIFHRYKEDMRIFPCIDGDLLINTDKIYEWQANESAAELLIPYKIFIPEFITAFHDCTSIYEYEIIVKKFACKYRVTLPVMEYRIASLCYELYQYEHGKGIDEIEILSKRKQIERRIHLISYRDRFIESNT